TTPWPDPPAAALSPSTPVPISASRDADSSPTRRASDLVPLGSPITGVTVTPLTASIGIGHTQQFTATVQGTGAFSSTVHWLVNAEPGGKGAGATLTITGLCTAPSRGPSADLLAAAAESD